MESSGLLGVARLPSLWGDGLFKTAGLMSFVPDNISKYYRQQKEAS